MPSGPELSKTRMPTLPRLERLRLAFERERDLEDRISDFQYWEPAELLLVEYSRAEAELGCLALGKTREHDPKVKRTR